MRAQRQQPPANCERGETLGDLPPGTPAWITPELVRLTLETWQPFYHDSLTTDAAVTILLSAGRLFSLLSRE